MLTDTTKLKLQQARETAYSKAITQGLTSSEIGKKIKTTSANVRHIIRRGSFQSQYARPLDEILMQVDPAYKELYEDLFMNAVNTDPLDELGKSIIIAGRFCRDSDTDPRLRIKVVKQYLGAINDMMLRVEEIHRPKRIKRKKGK